MIELVVVMGLAASGATALLRKFVDSFDGPIRIGPWVTTPKLWLLVAPMGCTTCMSGWMSIAEGVWLVGAQHFSPEMALLLTLASTGLAILVTNAANRLT